MCVRESLEIMGLCNLRNLRILILIMQQIKRDQFHCPPETR
jgi:hypothetical protein